jgi:hypothetical protein
VKATIIVEYEKNIKDEAGEIHVIAKTVPEGFEVSPMYWLGLLELGKQYILNDNWEE